MVVDQFEEMVEECARRPLVLNVSVHPYVFGQPYRFRPLKLALKHMLAHKLADRMWLCKPCEIADYCYSLPPGIVPGS
jgi:hypothetical protein